MSEPLVTVVIPTRNRADRVAGAVRSVLAQSHGRLELVVVDDASTDGTGELLASLAAEDGRLRVLRQAERQGASTARNRGARHGAGELLAFLDDDCRWKPDKLEAQIPLLDAAHGAVYCSQAIRKPDGGWIVEGRPRRRADESRTLLRGNFIGPSTLVVRRSLYDSVGGFDSGLTRLQDWDLILGLTRRTRFAFIDAVLVTGVAVAGGISSDRPALRDSAERMLGKHAPELAPAARSELFYGVGKALLAEGLTTEARRLFRHSVATAPTSPLGWFGLAASVGGAGPARVVRALRRRLAAFRVREALPEEEERA